MGESVDPITAVENQPSPLQDVNAFECDVALRRAVADFGAGWADRELTSAGETFGRARVLELARVANRERPALHALDRVGRRRDEVVFHPAWHELMTLAVRHGLIHRSWHDARAGSQVARAALFYLYAQVEAGTQCPLSMSHAVIPVLQKHGEAIPGVASVWLPGLLSEHYDGRLLPPEQKRGLLFGMGMTERQGGSDVRRNLTRAEPDGELYRITGHKWFFSAPMCDAFLILAQAPDGLSCFLLPQFDAQARRNSLHFQRLKDKLGNHSNASSEVHFDGATAYRLGEEGRGIATIIDMVAYTRLDCVLAAAGMMRRALSIALHHASQRVAFGKLLIDQPLMRSVLADLAIESEAATRLAMYLASCFEPEADETDRLIGRLLTPAAKFHVGKLGPAFAAEAMEVLGGNGYVEDFEPARLYRELPLLSIWEGSGNVMCLDVLRAIAREPRTVEALVAKLESGEAKSPVRSALEELQGLLQDRDPAQARRVAHLITLCMQTSLLAEGDSPMYEPFYSSRLRASRRWSYGVLPNTTGRETILARAAGDADDL